MNKLNAVLAAGSLVVASGCAVTNPPLMFGDITTFGLRIGNDTATAGGSVSLGYRAQSVAIVPVSVLDKGGHPSTLKGHGRTSTDDIDQEDAMSVFASFKSASASSTANKESPVQLGQVFSTGLAAQSLTRGYLCREVADPHCNRTAADTATNAAAATNSVVSSAGSAVQAAGATRADGPYQRPLLFLRTDVFGVDIGGSLAQQGLQFVLGYNNRNLALIPVYAEGADGEVIRVSGRDQSFKDTLSRDAFSVLGQFDANTETKRLGFGLERYFATGVAARNLGESLGKAIAKVPLPAEQAASAVPSATLAAPVSAALAAR